MIENPNKEQLKSIKGIIYLIRNKIDQKCYVGQSLRTFTQRYKGNNWWKHSSSQYLLNAVRKFGKENFGLLILEENIFDVAGLNKKEVEYQDKYNSLIPNGYNIRECGGSTGKQHITSIMKRCKKTYRLVDPDGKLIKIKNLTKFCRENDLCLSTIFRVINGELLHTKFWTKYDEHRGNLPFEQKFAKWIISLPSGEEVHVFRAKTFCGKYKLAYRNFSLLTRGIIHKYKGFSLRENLENPKIKPRQINKNYRNKIIFLISPEKNIIEVHNVRQYFNNDLKYIRGISHLINGYVKSYKGWKLLRVIDNPQEILE